MNIKKRFLSLFFSIALITAMAPWSALVSSASFTGALQFDANGKFTVMQIADVQSKKAPQEVINAIANNINRYHPDLVVFTGDNVIESVGSNFQTAVNTFLAPLLSTNTKFAVTFGNHDDEGSGTPNKTTQYNYYMSQGGNNFVDHDVAALDGVGNGAIPIFANGQTSGTPAYNVYVMDSGNNPSSGSYDACYTSQVDYYIQNSLASPGVPSIWFQHVVIPDMYTRCMTTTNNGTTGYTGKGSPFSSNKYYIDLARINYDRSYSSSISDMYKEGPCPANQSVYEAAAHRSSSAYGSKTLYEAWRDYGNFKGAYFGHDHLNKFTCTTSDGIDLGYGKGTTLYKTLGIISYNDGDPGCSIYQLDIDGSYTTEYSANTDLANKVLVAYDANGGLGTVKEKLFAKNTSVTLTPNAFAKAGYTFAGWNTAANGTGTSRANGATFTVGTTDITLYAQWVAATVNITFDANGGTGGVGPTIMMPGETLTAPAVTRDGYTFAGWSPAVPATVPSANTTYTAQWTIIPTLVAAQGSAAVINNVNHFIYGLQVGMSQEVFENDFVAVAGNGRLEITTAYGEFGTGTKIELIDGITDEVLETFYIVIYGDVNGDGNIDTLDAGIFVNLENYAVNWDVAADAILYKAADLNGDGVVDSIDAGIAVDAENFKLTIDQTTGLAG